MFQTSRTAKGRTRNAVGERSAEIRATNTMGWIARGVIALFVGVGMIWQISPAGAQGLNWPWNEPEVRPEPRPQPQPQPEFQPEPRQQPQQQGGQFGDPSGGWTQRSDVCLNLERRLVAESRGGNSARTRLPAIDAELRKVDRDWRQAERDLDRGDCYETFFFSKTLRRTRRCVDLSRAAETARRRVSELQTEKQQVQADSGQSYQDEIIRELARNNCGQQYSQEARKRDRNPFSALWGDDADRGSGYANSYNQLPFATYRTLCVRLCDGYYFPVSFSTLPNHFQRDEDVCQSKCAAPAKLFYHQNPGGAIEDMVDAQTSAPYRQMKVAFLYRKKYVQGCSCKQAEYNPNENRTPVPGGGLPAGTPSQQGGAQPADSSPAPPALPQGDDRRAEAGPPTSPGTN